MKNSTQRRLPLLLIAAAIALVTSCVKQDDLDFDNLATSDWNPDVAIPLVNADVSFADIAGVTDPTSLYIDADGRVSIVATSALFSQSASDFLTIPSQTDAGSVQLDNANYLALLQNGSYFKQINQVFTLALSGGQELDTVNLKKGNIDFTFTNSINRAGTITLWIPSALKNGVAFNQTIGFTSANGGSPSVNFHRFNLSGYSFRFMQTGQPNSIQLNYTINYLNNGNTSSITGNGMQYTAVFDSIEYSYASGYFGNVPFTIPVDTTTLSLFANNATDSFYFSEPSLKMTFENSVGVPMELSNINVEPYDRNGQLIELIMSPGFPNPKTIAASTSPGNIAYDSLVANSQNSNLPFILSQKPQYITYSANAQTNAGNPNAWNFITDESKFVAKLTSEIPIEGWASHFFVEDTFDFSIPDMEEMDAATFRLTATNGFPMSAQTQVYFVDSNFVAQDSLFENPADLLFAAAGVNANGVAISPATNSHDATFDSTRVEKLKTCKKVLVRSSLSTTDAPATSVKIYQRDKLNIKIGVRVHLKVKIG